jgi:flagellar motility protein MotE (MotC chaperone)
MTRVRVLPLAIAGLSLLLVLKATGLVLQGHYALATETVPPERLVAPATYRPVAAAGNALRMAGLDDADIITGSTPSPSDAAKPDAAAPSDAAPTSGRDAAADAAAAPAGEQHDGSTTSTTNPPSAEAMRPAATKIIPGSNPATAGEEALLKRLQGRRQQLDDRSNQLDMRENLISAAEKRLEARISELKATEARLQDLQKARQAKEDGAWKELVTMYESMRAKDAAKIFDGLDINVLYEVVRRMDPRKASDVIGKMQPKSAERLTVALATRDPDTASGPPAVLPKIQNRSTQ